MEPVGMIGAPAPTHDLLRLRGPAGVTANGPAPSWVGAALNRTPWVVVRRGRIQAGGIPVGVRGATRAQRFAAWLAVADIAERIPPEQLWGRFQTRKGAVPALAALARVAPLLARRGCRWGPGGSVGFELATSAPTATPSSDLDIILRQLCRLKAHEARALQGALAVSAAPVRIDVTLETPTGGVSLTELAAAPTHVLVRTPDGPRLAADPWMEGVA
jgi:phosphoribosyl-dephospho-CoA transferase